MRGKSILALAVALAMIFSVIPAFGLTASAAAEEVVLFDVADFAESASYAGNGDAAATDFGWSSMTGINFNRFWTDGKWGTLSEQNPALMFYRYGARSNGVAEYPSTTIDKALDTVATEKLTLSFNFAAQVKNDNYQEWLFKDNSGNTFARFFCDIGKDNANIEFGIATEGTPAFTYIDKATEGHRDQVQAMLGKKITITVTKAEDGYDVAYSIDDAEAVYTQKIDSVNGFASIAAKIDHYNEGGAAMGLQNLKITYIPCETLQDVQVTYKVGEDVIETVKNRYDTESSDGVELPEKYVYHNDKVYHADAFTATGTHDVPMEEYTYSSKAVGEQFEYNGELYKVTGPSVVVNGDFATGTAEGWKSSKDKTTPEKATIKHDETLGNYMATDARGTGSGGNNSLTTEWSVVPGQEYYASLWISGAQKPSGNNAYEANARYNVLVNNDSSFSLDDVKEDLEDTAKRDAARAKYIISFYDMVINKWTHLDAVFTADGNAVTFFNRWAGDIMNFAQVEIIPVEKQEAEKVTKEISLKYDGEEVAKYEAKFFEEITDSITLPAGIYGKGYWLENAVEFDYPSEEPYEADVQKLNVFTWNKNTNSGIDIEGNFNVANVVSWGDPRVGYAYVTVPEDYTEGRKLGIKAHARFNNGTGADANPKVKISLLGEDFYEIELHKGAETASALENAAATELAASVDFNSDTGVVGEPVANNERDVVVEITSDTLKAGDKAGLRLETVSKGIVVLSDVSIVTSYKVSAGESEAEVYGGQTAKLDAEEGALAYKDEDGNVYPVSEGKVTVTNVTKDMTLEKVSSLGVTLEKGAQVRIGQAYNADGTVTLDSANSGLRFIGQVNREGTLAGAEGAAISVKITAEGDSDHAVYIPITKYQDGDHETGKVFTAVLTNLKTTNYNRVFTATPVVTINDTKYEDAENTVSRSIFEVAAGILGTGAAEEEVPAGEKYELNEAVKAVLNAYVNAVGVRFTISTDNGSVTNSNDYKYGKSPVNAFDVSVTGDKGVYEYTVEPAGEIRVPDEDTLLAAIRINNNNKAVAKGITNVKIDPENGTITFTFTVENAKAE